MDDYPLFAERLPDSETFRHDARWSALAVLAAEDVAPTMAHAKISKPRGRYRTEPYAAAVPGMSQEGGHPRRTSRPSHVRDVRPQQQLDSTQKESHASAKETVRAPKDKEGEEDHGTPGTEDIVTLGETYLRFHQLTL